MADYRELLSRAVNALPENNGASRRQVYEKARSALVGQLRAIEPPLPAREITQHRLQLEDCIRQVEQSATDVLLGGLKELEETAGEQARVETAPETPEREAGSPAQADMDPAAAQDGDSEQTDAANSGADKQSGKDAEPTPADPAPADPGDNAEDSSASSTDALHELLQMAEVDEASAASADPVAVNQLISKAKAAAELAAMPKTTRADAPAADVTQNDKLAKSPDEIALADGQDSPVAMSSVREVEVDAPTEEADPQDKIDRAIETLDREARGEDTEDTKDSDDAEKIRGSGHMPGSEWFSDDTEPGDANAESLIDTEQASGGNALTIFLVVFVLLLVGAGGAGYWAWREGYVDLDAMFGQAELIEQAETTPEATAPTPNDGPGNTVATTDIATNVSEDLGEDLSEDLGEDLGNDPTSSEPEERLVELEPIAPEENAPIASAATGEGKIEERLPTEGAFGSDTPATGDANVEDLGADPEVNLPEPDVAAIGAQSLLLEVSRQGTTGAVPFSGTVDWSRGVDELGIPTLIAKASIPARNLRADILIRLNADPSLPASHLMEVNFTVSDSFIGGAIAGLPGILFKNEELVEGVPLRGASARVVGNSFLFALSASDQDVASNTTLMQSRKWMDLVLVYATGIQAIITLEKDESAQVLFDEVMSLWSEIGATTEVDPPAGDPADAAAAQ